MVTFIDTYEIESSVIDVIAPLSTLGYASFYVSSYAAVQQYINSSPFSARNLAFFPLSACAIIFGAMTPSPEHGLWGIAIKQISQIKNVQSRGGSDLISILSC